jgi:transketolase
MKNMREVFISTFEQLLAADERVVVLDADLAKASGTISLRGKYPKQCFDVGVAEQNMASVAAGLASYGYKPYITTFTPFATRRICDQVAISILYAKQNVKIIGTDPGITAELNGGTHISVEDIGVVRSIPGIVIFEAADAAQLKKALPQINDYEGCVYIRLYRKDAPDVYADDCEFDLFTANVVKKGNDVSIFASGIMVAPALEAAENLAKQGIAAEVVDVHTIKPIDRQTVIESAKKTGCAVVAENHNVVGGLRSAVLEALAENPVPLFSVGIPDRFGEVGKMPYLKSIMGMNASDIESAAKSAVEAKKNRN